MAKTADLYLVGTGINGLKQITVEAMETLRKCRIVFHTTEEHKGLLKLNSNVVDLGADYWTNEDREIVYRRLAKRIMDETKNGPGVASVIYGHPLFFDDVHMKLLKRSKRNGTHCVALPGISSLDTLSVDLGIDYGDGLQVLEATDMVENKIRINPKLHSIILQLGEFGTETTDDAPPDRPGQFLPLEKYLGKFFPANHRLVVAFSDDGDGAYLLKTRVNKLDSHRQRAFVGTTLYVPPHHG